MWPQVFSKISGEKFLNVERDKNGTCHKNSHEKICIIDYQTLARRMCIFYPIFFLRSQEIAIKNGVTVQI